MPRPIVFVGGTVALLLAVAAWRINESSRSQEIPFETRNLPPAAGPLCPWREPENDMKQFFPGASRYETETRVLSGRRLELAERLGRLPTGDENALHVYPVYREQFPLGVILTGRVKGEFGAIELVLAVDANDRICGVRLQRLREPAPAAAALQDPAWLRSFSGKSAGSSWKLGQDISPVPPDARSSAEAIVEGARSLLVLLATSSDEPSRAAPPH